MTIIEALKRSRRTGQTFMRVKGGGGFVNWSPDFVYKFHAEDLVADDWEGVDTGIPRLTSDRWKSSDGYSARSGLSTRAKVMSTDSPRTCAPGIAAEIEGCPTCCTHCLAGETSVWDDVLLHYAHPAGTGGKLKTCHDPWRERCRHCSGSPGACHTVR